MKTSAGILAYRFRNELEVFLVHPGGPFFKNKDAGVWSIPKGEYTDEEPLLAAQREFTEETGHVLTGTCTELKPVKLKSGKNVMAWAVNQEIETNIISNTFQLEWPPKSGKMQLFPEVDKAEWFTTEEAKIKINAAQAAFIDDLVERVKRER